MSTIDDATPAEINQIHQMLAELRALEGPARFFCGVMFHFETS